MKLVRTSVVVASVFCALAWSAESRAQSSGSSSTDQSSQKVEQKDQTTKSTKKSTKSTNSGGSGTSSSTSSSSSTTSGASGGSMNGAGTSGSTVPNDTMSGTGQTTGTGIGNDVSGQGTSGTMGQSGTQPYDQSGQTYPLGSQPMTNQQQQYGQPMQNQQQYGQPMVPPPSTTTMETSTTQTTAGMYDPSITAADREGTEYKVRPNRPLLVTGGVLFVGTYAASFIQGAVSPLDADRKNMIPVAGPWINMSERPCNLSDNCSTHENINNVLLIGSGVAQGVGVGLMLTSLFVPEHHKTKSETMAKAKPQKPEVHVIPGSVGKGGAGAFAVGTF